MYAFGSKLGSDMGAQMLSTGALGISPAASDKGASRQQNSIKRRFAPYFEWPHATLGK